MQQRERDRAAGERALDRRDLLAAGALEDVYDESLELALLLLEPLDIRVDQLGERLLAGVAVGDREGAAGEEEVAA